MRTQRNWGVFAAVAAGLASLTFAAGAQAASIHVEESEKDDLRGFAAAALVYEAEPGEANRLTVSVASESDGFFQLDLVDTGASIQAEAGCGGGGAVGTTATCKLRMPLAPEVKICGRPCGPPIARIGWETSFRVALGNGDDYFDAASIPDAPDTTYGNGGPAATTKMEVTGGGGDDRISTAGGDDAIDPGPGVDAAAAHAGADAVKATAEPDGTDVYNLGSGGELNAIDYGLRTGPIIYDAGAELGGAIGENDQIIGARVIVGGSGDDTIVGGRASEQFFGSDGNDQLFGAQGRDVLDGGAGDNRLIGGEGVDRLEAGDGDDYADGGWDSDYFLLRGGDDVAKGRQHDDRILLGDGDDQGIGGGGEDVVLGGEGGDEIFGGLEGNTLVGGPGPDRMVAGTGIDTIIAGTNTTSVNEPYPPNFKDPEGGLDSWRDTIECFGRAAKVSLNPWDHARRCTRIALVRAVEIGGTIADSATGTATLEVGVRGPGRMKLYGAGVVPVALAVEHAARVYNPNAPHFEIKPRGRALRRLHRERELSLPVKVRYLPEGGLPRVRATTVRLQLVRR